MKVLLVGKVASITHWLEHAAGGFRAAGHEVRIGVTRNPVFHPAIDAARADPRLGAPMAGAIARQARRFAPDLILVIGALEVPPSVLERLSGLPGRAPLIAWVGDAFGPASAPVAALFDLVAYTDSGLLARHRELGFASPAIWLPHAADPSLAAGDLSQGERSEPMAFVAVPTPYRRAIVAALTRPIALYGPGWAAVPPVEHRIQARRIAPAAVRLLYRRALAALNVRNEANVIHGLNQRSFEPCLAGAPVVCDDQPDLERCFDPGSEVLMWSSPEDLNAVHERLVGDRTLAAAIGEAGRRRVLADHTYARRLETLATAV